MHILDTDTLSHLHTGNENVIRSIQRVNDSVIATTVVTKIEMLRGRIDYLLKAQADDDLLKAQERFSRTEELLAQIEVLLITPEAVRRFAELSAVPRFRKIGRADLIISSIVLSHHAVLVTRNLRHFRQIPGLKVTNWVDN